MAEMGTIYLIHFERPYKHARHYLGWTLNLENRFNEHINTVDGSPLIRAAVQAGIKVEVVRTWAGTRDDERRLHKQKNSCARLCPECAKERMNDNVSANVDRLVS